MVTTAEQAFNERRPFALGEVTVSFVGTSAVVEGPPAGGAPIDLPPDPDAVRAFVREDALGRYRPLSGARTMPPGWRVRCVSAAQLEAVLDAVYPLALRHRAMYARDELDVVGLDVVLSRQTGRYRVARKLSDAGRTLARDVLCTTCVRAPAWAGQEVEPDDIPCPEPCSVIVALCREAALWEDEPPEPAPVDPGIAFAAFDEPGNEVREAFLAAMRVRQR
ncbi:MAG: hypothetical protein Kow0010_24040 [Dehalococcoidia bacterium]